MNPPEIEALVNAGFKLCAEIEDAIIAENVGLALEKHCPATDEVARTDSG